jgi:hypothetical protein
MQINALIGCKRKLILCVATRRNVMDKDRIVGATKEIKGSIKEKVGKAVGDAKLQSEGNAEKAR